MLPGIMSLILLNMNIISIVALEQQEHRNFLHGSLSSGHSDGRAHGVVVDESFGVDDLECREVSVDAARDYGFGVDDVAVEIIVAVFGDREF